MLIGLPTLRLRGDYIAIVTLAFGEIIGRLAVNFGDVTFAEIPILGGPLGNFFGEEQTITAGRQGISPVDKIAFPGLDPFTTLELKPWYWTALGLVAIVLFVNFRLRDSRLGRAWIALREDEVAAVSMGVPAVKTKLLAYGTGAAVRRHVGRVPRLVPEHGQRGPVPVLLLDPDPGHGHPRRPGLDLGGGAWCDRAVVHQLLADPGRGERRAGPASASSST